MNKSKFATIVITSACLGYLTIAILRSLELFGTDGNLVVNIFAISILAVVVISGYLIFREIMFGFAMNRMGRILDSEGALPSVVTDLPNGRLSKSVADDYFEMAKSQLNNSEGDWRAWYRLAITYSDARDRKRARASMRHAIFLFKQESQSIGQ